MKVRIMKFNAFQNQPSFKQFMTVPVNVPRVKKKRETN